MKLTASLKYNLKSKIYANVDVFVYNKQLALVTKAQSATGAVELKGYADINLSLEYRPGKRLSFFLNIQNLASTRYYKWNQYPSQRLNLLGGVTFSF
jgi:outer membrane receptor protein involved in Fe transport